MQKNFMIRRGRPDDLETIARFNIAMARETEGIELETETIRAGVRNLMQNPERGFYLVAESESAIAGCLMITFEWSDWRNGLFWWIQSVYVQPEFRRQGVYRRLYATIQKEAHRDPMICGFRLYVEKNNEHAIQTYRSLGMGETPYRIFEQTSER
ncbi:GNAT family N-acetyltransferase [candidate division KSB1 bacterium]|nr:GNAT family N-acetyltransferase [candidate division KSB1 bacterium]